MSNFAHNYKPAAERSYCGSCGAQLRFARDASQAIKCNSCIQGIITNKYTQALRTGYRQEY